MEAGGECSLQSVSYRAGEATGTVVVLRRLPDDVSVSEILDAVSPYSEVIAPPILRARSSCCAFVQFSTDDDAWTFCQACADADVLIRGERVSATISYKHSSISAKALNEEPGKVLSVLLRPCGADDNLRFGRFLESVALSCCQQGFDGRWLSASEALGKTVGEYLAQVFSSVCEIGRVVTYTKDLRLGVFALVELDSIASSVAVRDAFHMARLPLFGGVQLSIQFSNHTEVQMPSRSNTRSRARGSPRLDRRQRAYTDDLTRDLNHFTGPSAFTNRHQLTSEPVSDRTLPPRSPGEFLKPDFITRGLHKTNSGSTTDSYFCE